MADAIDREMSPLAVLAAEMRANGIARVGYEYSPDGSARIVECELAERFDPPQQRPAPPTPEEMVLERERRLKLMADAKAREDRLLYAAVEGFPTDVETQSE